ncbi:MAG: hypothetical protein O3C21_05815 [Verrucomicrobia bacterium]|nr:hypothetical protein [Verrucomicrobiota bacterium]
MHHSFINHYWAPVVVSFSALVACALVSCDRGPDQRTTSAPTAPAAVTKVEGGEFNKFFPKAEGDYDVIFISEKVGFAQAKLEKDGDELGTLAVSDQAGNAEELANYDAATTKIGGFPSIPSGSKGTAVLAGRFQVKVRSTADSFSASDREAWLEKFDLAGLAGLAK